MKAKGMINHRLLVHSKWCKTQKKRNKPVGDRDHEVLGMSSFGNIHNKQYGK
jgi:hypothetical protein